MTNYFDLSIVIPGVRINEWQKLYNHAGHACKRYNWEMIFSGPYKLPDPLYEHKNVKYIKNYGSPTRAFHLGTRIADGRFICILSDDANLYENSLDMCIDLLLANNAEKDIIQARYHESENRTCGEFPLDYWRAGYHGDTKQPGIDPNWQLALTPLVSLKYYNQLGGIDCLYEHVNFNMLDFGFRAIKNGSKILLSPISVMNCDFTPNRDVNNSEVISAYHNNDRDLFYKMYADGNRQICIEENWKESEPIWKRRKF